LRPNIVWFGEAVPMIEEAIPLVNKADIFVVIGTSLVVYPAAGLVDFTRYGIPKFIVDRKIPSGISIQHLTRIEKTATEGVMELQKMLKEHHSI
jgi:NAD-dependent deacetylase